MTSATERGDDGRMRFRRKLRAAVPGSYYFCLYGRENHGAHAGAGATGRQAAHGTPEHNSRTRNCKSL